jgi:hypothetical protein
MTARGIDRQSSARPCGHAAQIWRRTAMPLASGQYRDDQPSLRGIRRAQTRLLWQPELAKTVTESHSGRRNLRPFRLHSRQRVLRPKEGVRRGDVVLNCPLTLRHETSNLLQTASSSSVTTSWRGTRQRRCGWHLIEEAVAHDGFPRQSPLSSPKPAPRCPALTPVGSASR